MRRISRRELLKQGALAAAALSSAPLDALASMWKRHPSVEPSGAVGRIDPATIRKFGEGLHGDLILPDTARYESARAIYRRFIPSDKRPAMIVRCALAADVARSIEFARRHELAATVRSGGHDALGMSVCDGGIAIDVSGMKHVQANRNSNNGNGNGNGVVRAGAGLTSGELQRAIAPLGLATVLSQCPSVGISGFTLGGGLGWLSGKYGAGCDNLLSAEIVTADGRIMTASKDENPDLFWAIRGGGGNFGVATSLQYRLYPVDRIFGGMLTFPLTKLADFLRFYRSYMSAAPDGLSALVYAPSVDGKTFGVVLCYCGDVNAAKSVLTQRLKSFGRPLKNTVRPRGYAEMNMMPPYVDEVAASARYAKAGYLKSLSDDAIDAIVTAGWKSPSHTCRIGLDHYLHGNLCRVPGAGTAFDLREPGGMIYRIASAWRDSSMADSAIAWVNEVFDTLQPMSGGRAYVNYLSIDGEESVKAAYRANYSRLAALKKKYDPTNFFRFNRNIKPA